MLTCPNDSQAKPGWFNVRWKGNGHTNAYRFGFDTFDIVAVRNIYRTIPGEQVPRVAWAEAGYPLPEHVRQSRIINIYVLTAK